MKKVVSAILIGIWSSISLVSSVDAVIINPDNGHAYEYVNVEDVSWFSARDAAAASTYMGEHGYLATITSQEEQDFLLDNFPGDVQGWLGGSDAAQEGVWKWVVGPEAGLTFWIGGSASAGGYAVDYANWRSNQPSNEGGNEDYLVWRQDEQMKWNDLHFGDNNVSRYYIEYSIPEPCSLLLIGCGCLFLRRRKS